MESVYKFVMEHLQDGSLDKTVAVQLLKKLKSEEDAYTASGSTNTAKDIAIVGMALKLPQADSPEEFWDNIVSGTDSIRSFPASRVPDIHSYLQYLGMSPDEIQFNENAYLDEIDKFDYAYFKMSPKEASLTDPNHRLFLETAWKAIEDAGYGGGKLVGSRTGVYLGLSNNIRDLYSRFIYDAEPESFAYSLVGNLASVAAGRLSFLLDLKGPSLVVDTSCSSSLVAITLACQAIKEGQCDQALVGGIKINLVPLKSDHIKIGIESTDWRTKAFDDDSDGSGIGEGAGVVMLKPLDKALEDRDQIYAVIKGYGVNQDGKSISIAAPNPEAQTEAILQAWADAGIDPETVSYIETHGSGTMLGDPLEVQGIEQAFRRHTGKSQFCGIGSVKTNIGHLSEAAGVVGLIKSALSLKHKQIPASKHFHRPNRAIDFAASPVYVNARLREWDNAATPRRSGVSAFGISGTNCHIVLEEAPTTTVKELEIRGEHLLTVSAKTQAALQTLITEYTHVLSQVEAQNVPSLCYTANTGRGHYAYRLLVTGQDAEELLLRLNEAGRMIGADENLSKSTGPNGHQSPGIYYGYHKVSSDQNRPDSGEEGQKSRQTASLNPELAKMGKGQQAVQDILNQIGLHYVQGAELNWELLYTGDGLRKTSLPTYPFTRTRCWFEVPETARTAATVKCNSAVSEEPTPARFYRMNWRRADLNEPEPIQGTGAVLILKDEGNRGSVLIERLKQSGRQVIEVRYGESFKHEPDGSFTVNGSENNFAELFAALGNTSISDIVHLFAVPGSAEIHTLQDLEHSQQKGVYSLFYLIRALIEHGSDNALNMMLVSEQVYEVTTDESRLSPEAASLYGLGKVLALEYPHITCRSIDLDESAGADELLQEMGSQDQSYTSAYRSGVRYIEELGEVQADELTDSPVHIQQGGVYVITGGTGGIGQEMAKFFASQAEVKLVLIGRTPVPARSEWETLLNDPELESKTAARLRNFLEIEQQGSEVSCYAADVSDYEAMLDVLADVREKHGSITGVIHGAGVPAVGYLIRKTQETFDEVLHPKVQGAWILDQLTRQDELDFLVFFSSGLSLSSEVGQGDYSAANAYLDALSYSRSKSGLKTLSINWSSWKEAGMSVDYGFNVDAITKALPTEQATAGFFAALNKEVPRVLIGEFTYHPRFAKALLTKFPFRFSEEMTNRLKEAEKLEESRQVAPAAAKRNKSANAHVELKGKDGEDYNSIERQIAGMYNEVLGFEELDIHDSFFDLGGDSILLNRLFSLLEEAYPGKMKLIHLFSYTSVHALSQFVMTKLDIKPAAEPAPPVDDFEQLFKDIEAGSLSIDDAVKSFEDR
ncbi:SDR family NAD(P)-dependent oxidoreductase [Paenibacillus sp. FSL R5-0623]|uniref:SDR family NAD(P)-dependent oxidoreductase n=1 Tax=Paenibacillus sp. FSL R5-0623 TaxID=2921651 RepID=UPI0030D7BC0C